MNVAQASISQCAGFLDEDDVDYKVLRDGRVIKTGFRSEIWSFQILISVMDEPLCVLFLIRMPLAVPEEKRQAMAEAITRINYGMTLGRFEMDMSTGDLNQYSAIPVVDTTLTEAQFHAVLFSSLCQSRTYCRAFGRLLFDEDLTPAEAVAEVEMERDEAKAPRK